MVEDKKPEVPMVAIPKSRLLTLERYESAFLATADGVHQRDLLTGDLYRSPQWKAILGYSDEDWDTTRQDWSELLHPADSALILRQRGEIMRGERDQFSAEFRLRRQDGEYIWVRARAKTTPDADGKARYVTGVFSDITRERRLTEEREETLRALRRSQANLRHVMQQANCLLWQATVCEVPAPPGAAARFDAERGTDLSWEHEVVNDSEEGNWLRLERRASESVMAAWVRVRDRQDSLSGFRKMRAALAAGEDRYTQVYRTPDADGNIRYLLEDVRIEKVCIHADKLPVPGVESGLRCWRLVAVAADITERRIVEERLRETGAELRRSVDALHASNRELHQSNAALAEFVSVASHDLKEPLRKIQTFGDMLLRRHGAALNGDAQGYLTRMTSAAARMQTLIDGLMHLARASQKPIERQPVDLNEVARDVLSDLEVRLSEACGRVEVETLPVVDADALQMRQLFQNLIGNALKFHRQGVPPVVTIRAGQAAGAATLTFADNGVGFKADAAERIFKVFERLENADRTVEGTGVGLAICRKIVERHGWTIRAESVPGEGARFVVSIPVAE